MIPAELLCFPPAWLDKDDEWHEGRQDFAQVALDEWGKLMKQGKVVAPAVGDRVVVQYINNEEEWEIEAFHFSTINLKRVE